MTPVVAERGEFELARLIEGRVPGNPQSRISADTGSPLRMIDRTALVADAGNTVWVARPRNLRSPDRGDILVVDDFGSYRRPER